MGIFAGLFAPGGQPLDGARMRALSAALSRRPQDGQHVRSATSGPGGVASFYLTWLDEPFRAPSALIDEPALSCVIAGDPLFGDVQAASGPAQLDAFVRALRADVAGTLRATRGTFSAAMYDAAQNRLVLANDRLGVRSLYWADLGGVIVFASALRILEQQDWIDKALNTEALHQEVAYRFVIGAQTAYQEIRLLDSGESICVSAQGVERVGYFDWAQVPTDLTTTPETLSALYQCFRKSVQLRVRPTRRPMCFLSGGLDSRIVITELKRCAESAEVEPLAVNLFWPDSMEHRISAEYARALGVGLLAHQVPRPLAHPIHHYAAAVADALAAGEHGALVDRTRVGRRFWSGDGGSVCLGFVNSTAEIVKALREGAVTQAIAHFRAAKGNVVKERLFRGDEAVRAAEQMDRTLAQCLQDHRIADPGRALQLFMLQNQERQHLRRLYESQDVHGVDYVLPLFDAELVEMFQRFPLDEALFHRLYVKWLEAEHPPIVRQVPWQAYPGHVPSPLPPPTGEYQWGQKSFAYQEQARRNAIAKYDRVRAVCDSPPPFISRVQECAAYWLTRTRLRPASHLLANAADYRAYAGARTDLLD